MVAPMNTRLPAVVIAAPEFGVPVGLTPFAVSSSNSPSGTRHAMSPVFAFTATSSPHGGSVQLHRLSLFQNRENGPGVFRYPSPDASRCPHCPALCTLAMISPSGLLKAAPHQLLPPCAPGNTRVFSPTFHGVYGTVSVSLLLSHRF